MSHNANFSIDGYEISASFANTVDPSAISRAKQILLSSFIASTSMSGSMRKLAISVEKRDNNVESNPHVP